MNETKAAQKLAAILQRLNQDIDTGKTLQLPAELERAMLTVIEKPVRLNDEILGEVEL